MGYLGVTSGLLGVILWGIMAPPYDSPSLSTLLLVVNTTTAIRYSLLVTFRHIHYSKKNNKARSEKFRSVPNEKTRKNNKNENDDRHRVTINLGKSIIFSFRTELQKQ